MGMLLHKIVFILLIFSFCFAPFRPENNYDRAIRFIGENTRHLDIQTRNRIKECIVKFSWKYQRNPLTIAKQQKIESDFQYWKVNKSTAAGIAQIKPIPNKRYLYKCDSGALGVYLRNRRKKRKINYTKYFCRIGYGTEVQCIMMKEFEDQYGSEDLAIIFYGHKRKTALFYLNNPSNLIYNKYLQDIKNADQ